MIVGTFSFGANLPLSTCFYEEVREAAYPRASWLMEYFDFIPQAGISRLPSGFLSK